MQTKEEKREYDRKYYLAHQEKNIERAKKWQKEYREFSNKKMRERRKKQRTNVLNVISNNNPICVRCGCNDIRLLEINHINGGGSQEYKHGKGITNYLNAIEKGTRKTDDLELLCRVCNAWHYLELKYGKLPYKVIYKGDD